MDNLVWILLPAIAWPWVASYIWKSSISYQEVGLQIFTVVVLTSTLWFTGQWAATQDTEVWNGQIVSKDRDHGYYQTSYCCATDKDGNCTSTCYDDHYTVTWTANTTVGGITFDHLDRGSSSVYNTPDPLVYKQCKKGQPATLEHSYVNYVQAVPESLFSSNEALAKQFAGKIPNRPQVYNFYQYNRVIDRDGVLTAEARTALDTKLDVELKTLGASHQVNIIVILTKITDANFKVAVENAWQGGEKNDVVVFVGADATGNIMWADVMTWALNSGNELLQVTLRDRLLAQGDEQIEDVIFNATTASIKEMYVRPKMKDYEYLEDAIEPATWLIVTAIVLQILLSGFLTWFFHNYDVNLFRSGNIVQRTGGSRYRRYR